MARYATFKLLLEGCHTMVQPSPIYNYPVVAYKTTFYTMRVKKLNVESECKQTD